MAARRARGLGAVWVLTLLTVATGQAVQQQSPKPQAQAQQSAQAPKPQQQAKAPPKSRAPRPPGAPKPFVTTIDGDGGPPIGITPVGLPGTTTFTQVLLQDPLAVCNDGTQAAYYWAPGANSSTNLWVVYLEGAMFCCCSDRYVNHEYYMSNKMWNTQMAQGGIFAMDGTSAFGAANRVYVKYCSSDLWSGDAPASPETWNWNFRGSRIVIAVMNDLMQSKGLGKTDSQLLFGGCSAGAIGAMNNLEVVAQMMPETVAVKGFLDGAGLLNIPAAAWTWSPLLETLPYLMSEMLAVVSPQFPQYCQQLYPGELYKCLLGEYRMPMITSVPFFANLPQFDMFNLMYNTDDYQPVTPGQMQYVELFQTGTLALISTLPPGTGVFAPTCLVHCLSGQPPFANLVIDGTTMSTALATWYFNDQPVSVVSNCKGWNCISACGVDQMTGFPCNMPSNQCAPVQLQKDPTPNNWQEPPLLMPPWPVAHPPPAPGLAAAETQLEAIATTKLSSLAALVRGSSSPPPAVQAQAQGSEPPPPPPEAGSVGQNEADTSASAPSAAPAAMQASASVSGKPSPAAQPGITVDVSPASSDLAQAASASARGKQLASGPAVDVTVGLLVAVIIAGCALMALQASADESGQRAGERMALLQKQGVGAAVQQKATAIASSVGIDVRRRGGHDQPQPFTGLQQL